MLKWLVILILGSSIILSIDIVSHGGELYESGANTRNAALSNAVVSCSTGPAAIFANPALLSVFSQNNLVLTHKNLYSGLATSQLIAAPLTTWRQAKITIGLINRSVDNIPDTRKAFLFDDPRGPQLAYDQITYFSQNELGLILSYAAQFGTVHHFGVNLKPLLITLGSYDAKGLGVDIGYYREVNETISFGAFLQDATSSFLNWSTGTTEVILPRLVLGATIYKSPFLLSADIFSRIGETNGGSGMNMLDQTVDLSLGLEWISHREISFQAGLSTLETFSAGFQLHRELFDVGYAFTSAPFNSALKASHQFGVEIHLEKLKELSNIIEP